MCELGYLPFSIDYNIINAFSYLCIGIEKIYYEHPPSIKGSIEINFIEYSPDSKVVFESINNFG